MVDYEARLRALNVIEKRRFKTAAGHLANRKVNLEKVHKKDPQLAAEIAGVLAIRLCTHGRPDLIVPVPDGANAWGQDVALYMGSEIALLRWRDKRSRVLDFTTEEDRAKVKNARRLAIVDDVFTTGGSIELVSELQGVREKVAVAGVVWKRSRAVPNFVFPLESVVESYVPLMESE